MGGDGRGEGAAGPVRVARGMARAACFVELLAVEQHVDDIGRVQVAALDDDGPRSQVVQAARRLAGLRLGAHRPPRQCFRLRRIGGHDRGQWQQVPDQHGDGILGEQAVEALGDHHGVDDQRAGAAIPEHAGDRLDDLGRAQHPGLDGARADVLEHGHDLRHDHRGRHHGDVTHPRGVLGGDGGQGAGAEYAQRGERLQVGLDAGAAAGVAPRDCQCRGHGNCRISRVSGFHHHARQRRRAATVRRLRGPNALAIRPTR